MADPTTVTLVDPHTGKATDVAADQAQGWIDRGFTKQDAGQRAAQTIQDAREAQTSTSEAVAQGGLRGITFGGGDALQRAFGDEDTRLHLQDLQSAHPIASFVGDVGGSLLTGHAVGELGSVVEGLAGGGKLGGFLGAGAEGAAYGAGNAVSELALSDDPLTAEHIASVLGSNMLLGGAIGGIAHGATELVQRGLARAGEKLGDATAARAALEGMPEDLGKLDDKGLADAYKSAGDAHKVDIASERQSLEDLRVNQRAEVANQIRDLHEDLSTERPIFQAVTGDDVAKIDGVNDIKVQLAKSFKSMRSGLDSEISVARDPTSMIRPLEMRQAALEKLQDKAPELQAVLAGDERGAALAHVDDALAQTKQQIEQIKSLSKSNPVTSGRLTQLEAGPSQRMEQITAAREALKNAPEMGLVGKGATTAAFAGATALAHMIPGIGLAAPFVGKAAADAVSKLFTRTAGVVGKVAEKTSGAAEKFLSAAKSLEPYTAPTATKVLSTVKLGAKASEGNVAPAGELGDLYRQRSGELLQQTQRNPDGTTTMRPDARAAMAAKLDPIRAVNPVLADKVETVQAKKATYLAENTPKRPEVNGIQIGPDTWRPSDLEIRAWARRVRAVEDPAGVEERLARGVITPEESDAYRQVYPERFAALQAEIFKALPQLEKTLPMNKKVALSVFTGIPVTPAMQPNVVQTLQATFDVEPGSEGGTQAPRPQPAFGRFGSMKDNDKPTPSQERQL
jgi:hypothetical protein